MDKIKISTSKGLQIDNLVYNQHGELHAIRRNDFSRFDHPDMGGDYGIYAIEITHEILKKCGFDNTRCDFYGNEQKDSWFHEKLGSVYFTQAKSEKWWLIKINNTGLTSCKYLHQVQNFYQIITGEELTYNP